MSELIFDSKICDIAREYAFFCLNTSRLEHESKDYKKGCNPSDRLTNGGISWRICAENLCRIGNIDGIVECWMGSTGHKQNILHKYLGREGIGVAWNGVEFVVCEMFTN